MNKLSRAQELIFLMFVIFFYVLDFAHVLASENKNESPYFVILSNSDVMAQLPLQSTQVDVCITGVIADVHVKQVYTNTGTVPIEAVYVFPASTRAAVYKMIMKIGEREIVAEIQEKDKARSSYEAAKKQGRTASLLEEERPNVFKMNVANIVPGAQVEVNMSYTELLVPTNKIYEWMYPTVVGPRYIGSDEVGKTDIQNWNANPYLQPFKTPTSTIDIRVKLNTGIPIQNIRCETHKSKIDYTNKGSANVVLSERDGGNRDFIVQYQLAGNSIETGMLLYDAPNGEKYFLAMVQPPESTAIDEIPAREYVFIMDVSGSMNGFPLNISKQLLKDLLGGLRQSDRFNIVFFAGSSYLYSPNSIPVTEENVSKALTFIDEQRGSGSTELICALKAAMKLNSDDGFSRSFVILTDGYVTVEKKTFDYIRENLGNANFFAFGIGSSVNRYIIEGMAHVGYGEPFIATNRSEATELAKMFIHYISQPVLTNVSYAFKGFDAYDVLPEKVPDLFSERPIVLSGKYKGEGKGFIEIKGISGKSTITKRVDVKVNTTDTKALKYLWGREKIKLLGDYASLGTDSWSSKSGNSDDLKAEITALGLKYDLLTEYTSFIAIDSEISNCGGSQTSVKQPLPLPKGVGNYSIGSGMPPSPFANTLNVVEEDIILEESLEIEDTEILEDSEIIIALGADEEEEDDALVFMVVEHMPSFPGGDSALMNYLSKNVQYPAEALKNGITGRVYISFVVDTCGKVQEVSVGRGVDSLLDAEAMRVVSTMPNWIPGTQRGRKVNVKYMLPVNFGVTNNSGWKRPLRSINRDAYPYIVPPC